jgi:hypothetical protein
MQEATVMSRIAFSLRTMVGARPTFPRTSNALCRGMYRIPPIFS